MPQIFQVLRCYKCAVFQVHQTRKDNKWVCKLCGEKQSVKRHYGLGTGKECRIHVQKLNKMRGEKEDTLKNRIDSEESECDEDLDKSISPNDEKIIAPQNVSKESKWSVYVDKAEETNEISQPEYLNDKEVLLEIPKKRKGKRKYHQMENLEDLVNDDVCELNISSQIENKINSNSISVTNVHYSSLKSFTPKTEEIFTSNIPIKSQIETKPNPPDTTSGSHYQREKLNVPAQKIIKNSKWAQFIDNEDLEENENSMENKSKKLIFDLYDDSEIDTILDL